MTEIVEELQRIFPESTTYLRASWIEEAEIVLTRLVDKSLLMPEISDEILGWTRKEAQMDPMVKWLCRSVEILGTNLPHYILLWLATDKVHGFWRRKREKKLDDQEQWDDFSWSLRARIGATATLLGKNSTVHGELIRLFRNPLLFRLNPKGKLLPSDSLEYWEDQDGEWRRALDVLSYPLTLEEILSVRDTMVSVDRRISNVEVPSVQEKEWLQLTEERNIEKLLLTIDKVALFSLLPDLLNEKELKKYASREMLTSLCSYLIDFWQKMTEFEVLNHYFSSMVVDAEQGIGKDISFY